MTTKDKAKALLDKLGVSISSSGPVGNVDGDCVSIEFQTILSRNKKQFWSGPYRMGIGFVNTFDALKDKLKSHKCALTEDECVIVWHMHKKANPKFMDKSLQALVLSKLARFQKLSPDICDVMFSLFMDGSTQLDFETFESWCANYGYPDDSIKAKNIFEACVDTGRKLMRTFTAAELAELREVFGVY